MVRRLDPFLRMPTSNDPPNPSLLKEDDPELALLFNVLESTSSRRLFTTLHKISRSSFELAHAVKEELLLENGQLKAIMDALPNDHKPCRPQKIEIEAQYIRSDSEGEEQILATMAAQPVRSTTYHRLENPAWLVNGRVHKRKRATYRRQRFEYCINCGDEYDVTLNRNDSCRHHMGKAEIDFSHDLIDYIRLDGGVTNIVDDERMRQCHPGVYRWSCCGVYGLGHDESCMIGGHWPDRSKRIKVWWSQTSRSLEQA